MGKHTPLPSDPVAKKAEKKRRFAAYHKAWRKRRREQDVESAVSKTRARYAAIQDARQLNLDLCASVDDMTTKQLRAAEKTAREWLEL